jgi:NAD(P)-dependent dehydrogenase (short-subunit alcohol dehydrogenase family)
MTRSYCYANRMSKPVCVVVGVGPGNGAALARRFHAGGYSVALLARSTTLIADLARELAGSRPYACDVADEAAVGTTFAAIARDLGPVEVLIYNAGNGVWGTVEEVSARDFEQSWRVNALGALLAAKQVIAPMKQAGAGSIVFIGATASRRGNVKTAAFAPAKAAQRSLAESMARHLWPAGVHVALAILDGVVDLPRTRQMMPGKPDSFFIKPDDVAESVWQLTRQPRSAWTFELEARPFGESW